MASRLREDEKHERAIRALLRLEPNRRCINCNSLGPQYVCTDFWTFICTNCSGIHREFTHRVKSVSMAKFTLQEVTALQEGGNQRARNVYFKEWDAQHHSFPDSDNVNRLREFIKHVYVDGIFTGDSTSDKLPRVKNGGDKDGSYENRRVEAYQGGSKSPPYKDSHEHRYSDRSSPGGRSPGYDQESRQVGDYKRSPGRPPIINDRRREDRRTSDGDYKTESQSPVQARNPGSSSPPVGKPVQEILGENVVPLRISGPPKPNNGKAADASALTQRTASSGSLVSSNESQVNIKLETTKSLIDFDADPEPIAPTIRQAQQTSAPQPVLQPGNSSDDNWASFDIASEAKANQSTSNLNPLESVLSQLSYSASISSNAPGVQGPIPAGALSFGSLSSFPSNGASMPSSRLAGVLPHNNVGQWASSQHQQPMFSAVSSQPSHVPSVPTGQRYPNTPIPHAYHHASELANEAFNSILSQPSAVEVKPSGRTELSEDLFTTKHSSFSAPVQGWQAGLPQGAGSSVQYNSNVAPIPSFSEPSRSTNPFDVSSKQYPDQDPSFLSISSLHSAMPSVSPSLPMHPPCQSNPLLAWSPPLPDAAGTMHSSSRGLQPDAWNPPLPSFQAAPPNVPSSGTLPPSSLGNPSHAWNPTLSSPYASFLPPQAPIHASALGPGSNNGQQMPTNTPMPRQEAGNFGAERDIFALSNPDQQPTDKPSTTPTSNPFPKGGNPFA
ncbi:probable ADP-ribosylation factor GTPase-activating protein AGD14 isoform X1 [Vicia villosa]|uniref:probable ADP-ribosylation factor GTPase-activating protein AGD14 isoform X1 n=1 Tax=Vicia villosa TaxID=3911 RepID=UPI00273AEED1|nr:probable ADP-ribosylation factor GTPase-activating protein AGD14 isoform X1 [Vicia villosa]